jgi:PST family polysaccharide transporter
MAGRLSTRTVRVPRLALNFAVLSGGELLSKILAAVAFASLARVLGPTGYGQIEFALAVIVFFTLAVDGGLSAYGARELAKDERSLARLATHIAAVRGALGLAAFAVLAGLAAVIDKPWATKQLLLLYGLTLLVVPGLLPWAFQGRDMMRYVAAATAVRWSLFAAGVLVFVHEPGQLWLVPLVETGAIGVVAILYVSLLSRSVGSLRHPVDLAFAVSIFRQALPIGAAELVWAGKVYFATVLLGLLSDGSEVGWFGAAHRLVIALHTFVWLYFFNLLPSLARSSHDLLAGFRHLIGTSMQITVWGAVFLGVVGSAFAEPLITLVYGPLYHQAVEVFQILIWLVPLALVSGNFRYTLIAAGKQQLEFVTAASGAGLNIALSILLIPRLGLHGAALAIILSELLILGLAAFFVERAITPISIRPHIWRPLVAGGVLVALLYALSGTSLWIAGGAVLIAYALAAVVLQPKLLLDVRALLARNG